MSLGGRIDRRPAWLALGCRHFPYVGAVAHFS